MFVIGGIQTLSSQWCRKRLLLAGNWWAASSSGTNEGLMQIERQIFY